MKKLVVVLFVISLTIHAFCAEKSVIMEKDDIVLKLDNIILKDVSFIDGNKIIVCSKGLDDIDIVSEKFELMITAEEETQISLQLPKAKRYQYQRDDVICKFDSETINVEAEDVFVVISEEGIKVDDYENGSKVTISDDGIIVNSRAETVKINNSGIVVEDSKENIQIKGPLGFVVSFFARNAAATALNKIGRTPGKVLKYVVNDTNEDITFIDSFGSM